MMQKILLNIGDIWPLYMEGPLAMIWQAIVSSQMLAGAVPLLIASVFAYWYFESREFKEIQSRYIDSIKRLADHLRNISSIIQKNYASTLQIYKMMRDLDNETFKIWCGNNPIQYEKFGAEIPKDLILAIDLIGDTTVAKACLNCIVSCFNQNEIYATEIPLRMQQYLNNPANQNDRVAKANEMKEAAADDFVKLYEQTKLHELTGKIEEMVIAIKAMKIKKYKDLQKLRENKSVISAVKVIAGWKT